MFEKRNYSDPLYKNWRVQVYKRDGFKCQLCKSTKRLEAHHIKRWAEFPQLRFDINNGVTLCKICHRKITNNEQQWEPLFIKIVGKNAKKED